MTKVPVTVFERLLTSRASPLLAGSALKRGEPSAEIFSAKTNYSPVENLEDRGGTGRGCSRYHRVSDRKPQEQLGWQCLDWT